MRVATLGLMTVLALAPGAAFAQALPSGPYTALDGHLSVGAEVVATLGNEDEIAFFNYTDYEHNVFRMFRVALSAAWRPLERVALVGEVRSEDFAIVRPYAAYVRVRPWRTVPFDVQAGRIPPTFGAFGRRTYTHDNPLIGYPLAYQYLTALRPDAVPATIDDLVRMRARGWRATYPVGSQEPEPGVPLVSAFRWDTGVQAHWGTRRIEAAGAFTVGTLSNPRVTDDNDGRQISGRVAVHPVVGLTIGSSAAYGSWLSRSVERLLTTPERDYAQAAWGTDVEYSRDYWLVRGEIVWSRWDLPIASSARTEPLDARGMWLEGRYRLTPQITVAGRIDRLDFARIVSGTGEIVTWDAPVRRLEADVSYYFQRNLVGRLAVQHNDRDGRRIPKRTYFAGQLAYWF